MKLAISILLVASTAYADPGDAPADVGTASTVPTAAPAPASTAPAPFGPGAPIQDRPPSAVAPEQVAIAAPAVVARATRWLSIGAMTEMTHYQPARGVRADLDVLDVDGWILGVGAAFAHSEHGIYDGSMTALLDTTDLKGVVYVARAAHFRRFDVRGALGVGVVRTSASGVMTNLGTSTPVESTGLFPTAEASLRATVPISPRWAVMGGPVLTYYHQTFEFTNPGPNGPTHREGELMMLLGLGYRW